MARNLGSIGDSGAKVTAVRFVRPFEWVHACSHIKDIRRPSKIPCSKLELIKVSSFNYFGKFLILFLMLTLDQDAG